MDIYDFIRSSDVADHCRKIEKTWDTCEMAILISRCNLSKKKKHKAWQELIDNYPDMPASPAFSYLADGFDSIHEKLKKILDGRSEDELFDSMMYVDIPVPFKQGDLLKNGDTVFVLEGLCLGTEERYRKYVAQGSWLDEAWCYFVDRNGVLYGDHKCNIDFWEFYKGKLENNNRLLHYVSLFLNKKIGLPALLTMQCRIVLEHQLSHSFPINVHGCFISEEHLVDNRLTPDEKVKIEETNGLMPWVKGKLSIYHVEFLSKEFKKDTEQVQVGLANGGGSYLGLCAGIVHDENRLARIGDTLFNPERRAMAKMVLEAYGRDETGWTDNSEKRSNKQRK